MEKQQTIVIVGAGLAGLSAAKYLHDKGVSVVVLEARNRIGGRTLTVNNGVASNIDLGGTYVGLSQKRIPQLAEEFGIEMKQTSEVGDFVFYSSGESRRYKCAFPPMKRLLAYLDVRNVFRLLQSMAAEVPPDSPWDATNADQLDKTTFKQFLDKTVWTKEAYNYTTSLIQAILVTEPHECSLLWILWRFGNMYWRPDRLPSFENGHKKLKFVNSSRQLSEALFNHIGKDNVLLGHAVSNIREENGKVIVKSVNNENISGHYVIVAVPTALQNRITFDPPLPSLRQQLFQHIPSSPVITIVIFYKRAFWKEKGYCGTVLFNDEAILSYIRNEDYGEKHALKGYITGNKTFRYSALQPEERKKQILALLRNVFGVDEALEPEEFTEYDWVEDQWTCGGYTVTPPPGYLTNYAGHVTEPFNRVHFANSETGTLWHSTMEGAILEGERAAKEILQKMGIEKDLEKQSTNQVAVPQLYKTLWMRCLPSVPVFSCVVGSALIATGLGLGLYLRPKFQR